MIFFYLLVSVMPLVRHPFWSEFAGDLTMIKYAGALCLGYAFFYVARRGSAPHVFATWQARWFVLFALLGIASFLLLGVPQPMEISPLMSLISFLALFLVTVSVVDSVQRFRLVLLVAIASVAYASLHTLREWQKYGGMMAGYRPGWITGDPNYFSVSALLCLPVAFYLIRASQPWWGRWLCFGSAIVILLAMTLAASRGALLGLVAAAALVVWRTRRRVRNSLIAGMVFLPLMLVAPSSPLERFLNPHWTDHESADTRALLWDAGLQMVTQSPLTGIGTGNFKPFISRLTGGELEFVAHNTYLEIAAENGLPGLIFFLLTIGSVFRSLERWRRPETVDDDRHFVSQAALGMEAGLLGACIALFFLSAQYQKLIWLLVFLSMCLPTLLPEKELHSPDGHGQDTSPSFPPSTAPSRSGR